MGPRGLSASDNALRTALVPMPSSPAIQAALERLRILATVARLQPVAS